MTTEEAKFILGAYRASGSDAADPMFAAALEQAAKDPTLAAWFAREQAQSATIAAKLREIQPPPELRGMILTGAAASQAKRGRVLNAWRMSLMAAAAILVVGGATAWWTVSRPDLGRDPLIQAAIHHALEGQHGGQGEPASALQARLADTTTAVTADQWLDFGALKATGCRTIRVAGYDVLEVCFAREGAEYHFYVARRTDASPPRTNAVEVVQRSKVAAASWADATHRFVLVSADGVAALKRVL